MSFTITTRPLLAIAAMITGLAAAGSASVAGPATSAASVGVSQQVPSNVETVRHRRFGGIGIYIGPGYGYYPRYGYSDDSYYGGDYYPRYRYRRSYYNDDGYRPYRRHSRRWVKERFEHPLGRR